MSLGFNSSQVLQVMNKFGRDSPKVTQPRGVEEQGIRVV